MSRNIPIGTVADPSRSLAFAIRRRICTTDGPVQVWTEHGNVYAQGVLTKAAKRIDQQKPDLILAVYTRISKTPDIEDDVLEMQKEVIA